MNPISSILSRAQDRKINILTAPTHERYETNLSKCNVNFFAIRHKSVKDWDESFSKKPDNYHLLPVSNSFEDIVASIPDEVDIDLILSQNKFGQYQLLKRLSNLLQCPLISLEHTLPLTFYKGNESYGWPTGQLNELRNMNGDVNVFISEMSKNTWLYDYSPNNVVIEHGVDTELFSPKGVKKKVCLSVVNDWINRDIFCGYKVWCELIEGFPAKVLGKTEGLSKVAKTIDELVQAYQESLIFVNTSQISPIPSSLLEAMSCGCAPVSTATCMIPEIIENGVNGFCSNDVEYLKGCLSFLLKNPDKAIEMGERARQTVIDRFPLDRFVKNWERLFYGT